MIQASWRDRLRSNKLVYRFVYEARRMLLDARIRREQTRLEKIAERNGVLHEQSEAQIFEGLVARLAARGIEWPPRHNGRPLHILYASLPGNWEPHNIPPELAKLGDVSTFFLTEQGISWTHGWAQARREVDQKLPVFVQALHARKPIDLMLSYLSGAQVSTVTLDAIASLGIPMFSFHLDDRRAFFGRMIGNQWSGPAAVCNRYDLNLTNASASLVKYRAFGANVLFWPEGANPDFFRPLSLPEKYDVTFCGQRYGVRPMFVDYLRHNGIKVDCFGHGWEHGYAQEEDLVRIFNQSRINLGFGYVNESSDQCLKGRDFEVPACGAVYVTSLNGDIEDVYRVGQEIETYYSPQDCLQKIRNLLPDQKKRAQIKSAARDAVESRHSWAARMRQLLTCSDRIGASPRRSE